jgi:hypothetical protein
MRFHSRHSHTGLIRVTPWFLSDTGVKLPGLEGLYTRKRGTSETFPNLITDAGLDAWAAALRNGNLVDLQVGYLSLGADSTAPAGSDTALGDERYRKRVTARSSGGTGVTISSTYIAPGEANATSFDIAELGWWINNPTATLGSGTLLAHVLYSRSKVAGEALQVDRTDTISR